MNSIPRPRCRRRYRASGFTLIELLTVIAIIGILAAIIVPTVSAVRAAAVSTKSASNLRQMGSALQLFLADQRHPKLTNRRTFDVQLIKYMNIRARPDGLYGSQAEGIFFHPNDPSPPYEDGRARRSYAQNTLRDGASASELLDDQPIEKIPVPSQTMIYTERAWSEHAAGYIGLETYTGIYAGNHDPAGSGSDNRINGTRGKYNYCFIDGHVESQMGNSKRMLGERGTFTVPRGAWTITAGD